MLDHGSWYREGGIFVPGTVSDLTDTGLGGRDSIDPDVGFYIYSMGRLGPENSLT